MCDPISLLAVAGSAVAAGVNYAGQQSAMNAQQKANDDWVSYQRQKAREADQRDEALRQKSDVSRNETLNQLDRESQQGTQEAAAGSLEEKMLGADNPAGDQNVAMLAGGVTPGADAQTKSVEEDMASRVTNAAREARSRIKALASLTATTGGYGGMLDTANRAITTGNQGIEMQSNKRKGNTAVLGTAQAVPVETFTPGSNIAGSIAGALAGLGGNALGAKFPIT
jgi:hypothetical protein